MCLGSDTILQKQISIALTTYNGGKYLSQQLDSILTQTLLPYEIIIVDDASTDNTIDIIHQYIANHNLIKLYQNETNIGIVKSFERAISLCISDYVALCDQDDVWMSYKLQRLIDNIGDNYLIHSDAVLVDENLQTIELSHFLLNKDKSLTTVCDYLYSNNVTGCCAMISRELIDLALPIPDNFYMHDYYFALIAVRFNKIKLIDEPLLYYRQHSMNSIGAKLYGYSELIKLYNKLSVSFDSLNKVKIFNEYKSIIKNFKIYYMHMSECRVPSWRLCMWVYKNLGIRASISFINYTSFGIVWAKIFYKLTHND